MKKKLIIAGVIAVIIGITYTFTIILKDSIMFSKYEKMVEQTTDKEKDLEKELHNTKIELCTYTKRLNYLDNTGRPDWTFFDTIKCTEEKDTPEGGSVKEETKPETLSQAYGSPDDLFFMFLKKDSPYISQTLKQHFANNGYLATDVATNSKKLEVYAPSFMFMDSEGNAKDEEREYTVHVAENYDTMGWTIELHWIGDDKVPNAFWIGHMNQVYVKDGDKVKTGDKIGLSGGCPGELKFNEKSTGCHAHFEYRIDGQESTYPGYMYSNHGIELTEYRLLRKMAAEEAEKKAEEEAKANEGKVPAQEPIAGLYTKYNTVHPDMSKVLEAIHQRESGKCTENCKTSYAGAKGPFQFMNPTWKAYGCDGDGNGSKDAQNVYDAACGAQNYLITLFNNEKSYNQGLDDKWIWWKAFYRYNAGYATHATHADGYPAGIAYADDVLRMMYNIQ